MHRSLLLSPTLVQTNDAPRAAILAKGFRPFFLLAGIFAVAIVPLWLLILGGTLSISSYLAPVSFHAHEMLFGFVAAVLAGFLLTAVGNWTQRETAVGGTLLALAILWFSGRVAMFSSGVLPRTLTAAIDLAFLPALAWVLARPLLAAKSWRNFGMLAIIAALFAVNGVVHLEANGLVRPGAAQRACAIGVDLVLLVILIMAGRVFPMFTRNATGVSSIRSIGWLERATIGSMLLSTACDLYAPESVVTSLLFAMTGALGLLRALHWGTLHSLRVPLLWSLHAGYGWLCIGLLARAGALLFGGGTPSLATHALTVGAIGGLTLSMMARVALGHTGRMLVAAKAMSWAFFAINAAALLRSLGPLLAPSGYYAVLAAAGALWSVAFAIFSVVYAPMLLRPRVDNRPG